MVDILPRSAISNTVNTVLNRWISDVGLEARKTPNSEIPFSNPCVKEWADMISDLRENSIHSKFGGNVEFPGGDLHWTMSIPYLLDRYMEEAFGKAWKWEPEIWNYFKRTFKIGSLNPNPKKACL